MCQIQQDIFTLGEEIPWAAMHVKDSDIGSAIDSCNFVFKIWTWIREIIQFMWTNALVVWLAVDSPTTIIDTAVGRMKSIREKPKETEKLQTLICRYK